ncbi:DUF1592 domain-containing protein [Humisphaera borealis]|uniref:DUF1592 domain-containing protein n=1 Tax=Humisphaera borealis TaxID=2807512 RepID=A0A7M2WSG4_9BACT|nr:DUF1592 domain-containing protein [Humisphaera borealis]
MDLEKVDLSLSDKKSAMLWESVFHRVASGEMPPKNKSQPAPEARAAFLAELGKDLRKASLARQEKEGRGPVRRLTRTEYETTVNDLLHIRTDLRSSFPDDAVTAGFDKVGEGLTLSAAHFAAYQEAAEKALNQAIMRGAVLNTDSDGAKVFAARPKEFTTFGGWLEGNTMALASRFFYPYTTVLGAEAPRNGRYRITFTAQARGNGGRPMPVAIGILDSQTVRPDAPETSLWFDVPEDRPRTVAAELDLEFRQHFHLFGPSLVHRDVFMPRMKKEGRWDGPVLLLSRLKIEGPLKADGTIDHWPGTGYRELFDNIPAKPLSQITGVQPEKGKPEPWFPASAAPKEDAARLLRRFLPKAFRRPVPEDVAAGYTARAHEAIDRGVPFHRVMLDSYKAVLCSPHFLLLEEKPAPLGGPALASRLSYFLWNSAPDEVLLAAAVKGELATRDGRARQVERMLNDRRAERFERSFIDQWLDLKNLNATSPDGVLYSEITPSMVVAAELETRRFFHDLLAENRSALESIQSDWTYSNELLSALYDLPDVAGYEMRRVPLTPQSRRGGFLTQASVLKVTADGAHTSPIIRGKWVNERILGVVPPKPPEDVPKIEPDIRGATTIREQLAKHRSTPACMSCHTVIDPPGFALETFDVMGGWRDYYRMPSHTGAVIELKRFGGRRVHRGPAVESGYTMPDGRAFADITAYKALLLEDKERIVSAFAANLLTYATGSPVQFADRDDLAAIVAGTRANNFGVRSLIHAVVQSRPFLHK